MWTARLSGLGSNLYVTGTVNCVISNFSYLRFLFSFRLSPESWWILLALCTSCFWTWHNILGSSSILGAIVDQVCHHFLSPALLFPSARILSNFRLGQGQVSLAISQRLLQVALQLDCANRWRHSCQKLGRSRQQTHHASMYHLMLKAEKVHHQLELHQVDSQVKTVLVVPPNMLKVTIDYQLHSQLKLYVEFPVLCI